MADLIHAGEIGGVALLINDDGDLILRQEGQSVTVDRAGLSVALESIRPLADLVARSATPISGMSERMERSLEQYGCKVVTDG